ncbi:MAG: L-2-hydroxyglutarate oxidase [Flavobacteriales bacterium]
MSKPQSFDIIIVGGGCVGLASAYKLQRSKPDLNIAILEKESDLALHQTGRNSGVIHSGLYYKPGSLRAENCYKGRNQLVEFCKTHQVTHDVCGKIVVATSDEEVERLQGILERGIQNGLQGLELIDREAFQKIEPYIEGKQAIWVPEAGIVDYRGLTHKLAELIQEINPNSKIFTNCLVKDFNSDEHQIKFETSLGVFEANNAVFCTGLQADRMAKKEGLDIDIQTVGFRGDYYDLTEKGKKKIKNLVYPVPNPAFPFLGVHFTRMFDGTIECGPNAVFTFKREGYGKTDFDWKDSKEALSYAGTWKLFAKHWRFGLKEYQRAFSKKRFLEQLQILCPSLEMDDITTGRSGVRAIALGKDGEIFDDFKIINHKRSIHVLNAPSPAATACLAIGDSICEQATNQFNLSTTQPL